MTWAGEKKARRGRPPLDSLRPWLEKMHSHVIAGASGRKAALIVATGHHHEIPQGSAHQRTLASTIDLLRRKYAEWQNAEADYEQIQARAQNVPIRLTDLFGPDFRAEIERNQFASSQIAKSIESVWDHPDINALLPDWESLCEAHFGVGKISQMIAAQVPWVSETPSAVFEATASAISEIAEKQKARFTHRIGALSVSIPPGLIKAVPPFDEKASDAMSVRGVAGLNKKANTPIRARESRRFATRIKSQRPAK